jgi:hypothetical protein
VQARELLVIERILLLQASLWLMQVDKHTHYTKEIKRCASLFRSLKKKSGTYDNVPEYPFSALVLKFGRRRVLF